MVPAGGQKKNKYYRLLQITMHINKYIYKKVSILLKAVMNVRKWCTMDDILSERKWVKCIIKRIQSVHKIGKK